MSFSKETLDKINALKAMYATARGCVMLAITIVQEAEGPVTPERVKELSMVLGVPSYQIAETLSFYTMYNRHGRGKHHIQICRNISCYLRGADAVVEAVQKRLNILPGEVSADGQFELELVECLGNCHHAPAGQLGKDDLNVLTHEKVHAILDKLGAPHGL